LSAPLAGWSRLPYAQQWLDQHGIEPVAGRTRFDEFLKQSSAAGKLPADTDKEALFRQFKAWEAEQNARAQAQAAPRQR
jgi:hypothetical protein